MKLSLAAIHAKCPHCANSVVLRAPDHSERVVCEHCHTLSEVRSGEPRELELLRKRDKAPVSPLKILPLGTTGKLNEVDYVVVAHMRRILQWCKEKHEQDEYWLFNQREGFRRLLYCEQHWSLAEKIATSEVNNLNVIAYFRDNKFERFDESSSQNEYMVGEFVGVGALASDRKASLFVRPPLMLICENHKENKKALHGWWLATYLEIAEVERAFGLADLAEPKNIAPHQPYPYRAVYRYWGILAALLFLTAVITNAVHKELTVFSHTMQLRPVTGSEETQVFFSEPFELAARKNLRVTAQAPVNNSWLYVEGDLINEATGIVHSFVLPVEYYYGYEGGEYWSEGSTITEAYLSALPAGKYTLRVEVQWEQWMSPFTTVIQLQQGVPRLSHFWWALAALSAVPLFLYLFHSTWFERKQWQGSPFMPDRLKPKEDDD